MSCPDTEAVGMIFQSAALFDSLSVLENVMFPLDMFSNVIQHFQTIINYPLPGSSFAGRSNLCRYNITFSVPLTVITQLLQIF